MPMSKNSLDML